jgi:RNA-directed DNA polymerase
MEPRKRHKLEQRTCRQWLVPRSTCSPSREDQALEERLGAASGKSGWEAASLPGSETSTRQQMSLARKPGEFGGACTPVVGCRQVREGDEPQSVGAWCSETASCRRVGRFHSTEEVDEVGGNARRGDGGKDGGRGEIRPTTHVRAQDRNHVTELLDRIGEKAKAKKGEQFTNLLSHIKQPLLAQAYTHLRKSAAAGVDGETWRSYGEDLDAKLLNLQDRVHRGAYHPPPVRRVHIPKSDGSTRPLGIPTLEDKLLQEAVRMLLQPIYESEFVGFSYGFRPGRSQHKALDALYVALYRKVSWVLDADIRSFFDTIDHEWMTRFLEHRIGDRRFVRLLVKWLQAGVLEDGKLHEVHSGTPQGGIVSPLLANIYLHYVLDLWADQWRKRHARGEVYIVRYADDAVMCFQFEGDARAMREALAERMAKFGLQLHSEKTRIIRFGRYAYKDCGKEDRRQPETFDFLGFTHISARGPDGRFRVIRRTSRKKRTARLRQLRTEMRRRRHDPVPDQHRWVTSVLRGHANYYGVPGNSSALRSFQSEVRCFWHHVLQRRGQRKRWTEKYRKAFDAKFPVPNLRITHPHPQHRFSQRLSRP